MFALPLVQKVEDQDGVLVISGKPPGYLSTNKTHSNYISRHEWRFKRPEKHNDDSKFTGKSTRTEGPLGFQFEGIDFHLRNIQYKPIK